MIRKFNHSCMAKYMDYNIKYVLYLHIILKFNFELSLFLQLLNRGPQVRPYILQLKK